MAQRIFDSHPVTLGRHGSTYPTPRAAFEAVERYLDSAGRLPEGEAPTTVDVWGGKRDEGGRELGVWHHVPARLLRKGEAVPER